MLFYCVELVVPPSSVLLVWVASSSEKTAKKWLKIAAMPARGKLEHRPTSPQQCRGLRRAAADPKEHGFGVCSVPVRSRGVTPKTEA